MVFNLIEAKLLARSAEDQESDFDYPLDFNEKLVVLAPRPEEDRRQLQSPIII